MRSHMERLWDPGAAQKGTQLHRGKQAGCWMWGDSASTIHQASFPPPQWVAALAFATQVNAVHVITFCVILGKTGRAMSSIQTQQGMLSFMITLIFVLLRGAFILRSRGGRWDFCRAVKKGLQTCCYEPFFDLHQWPLEMSPWSLSSITPLKLWG